MKNRAEEFIATVVVSCAIALVLAITAAPFIVAIHFVSKWW